MYGEKLKVLRERNGITQEKLGEYIGVTKQAFHHFEKEYTIIPIKHLNSICTYFNVSLDYMFGFTNKKQYDNWKKDIDFSILHEGETLSVKGFVAIRIPGSVKDAGLTLIRRGRVIVGGSEANYKPTELFGDSNSYAWQRLFGELHMDNWPVTQAKDNFDWHNSGLEEAFIQALEPLIRDYRKKAENIRVRERIDTNDLVTTAITGLEDSGLVENVNIEIVDTVTTPPVSSIQSENIPDNNEPTAETETVSDNEADDGVIIDGGKQVNYSFKYKNIDYLFHIVFDVTDPSLHWLLVEPNGLNEYTLSINMKHSFFKPLIEKKDFLPIMTRMCIALVLAEIESMSLSPDGKIEPCDIRLKMNEILENVRKNGGQQNGLE